MCGIVGYVGARDGAEIVMNGLRRLEYRGYDSAGLAVFQNGKGPAKFEIRRCEGRLENLANLIKKEPVEGSASIGHTRWATHGKPSKRNAHPHRYKDVVIVHNGIIENYKDLRQMLSKKGHKFVSETDSEVIAHLLQRFIDEEGQFESACARLVKELEGAFAIVAMWKKQKHKLFIAKQQCPIVLGLGEHEQFVASDVAAILEHTRNFIFLDDREMAFVGPDSYVLKTFDGKPVERRAKKIKWSLAMAEKDGYDHFMQKEMYQQPQTLADTIRPRFMDGFKGVQFEGIPWKKEKWKSFDTVYAIACGTAWHASLVGKYWIEQFSRTACEVDLASEFRYRKPVVRPKSLTVAVSQSGETADTIAAMDEAIRNRTTPLSITNTVDSSIVRKTKNVIYTHAGPEIAVASTKCFIAQLAVMALLAVKIAQEKRKVKADWVKKFLKDLSALPAKIEEVLALSDEIREIANRYYDYDQYFYLGRGLNYPVALEGALKIKEIAYINTQAYPAGEMKHGPIALISEQWPCVSVAPDGTGLEKMVSNMEEVKSRGGKLITIGTKGNKHLESLSDEFIGIPKVREELTPFLTSVVTQLFSYHMAVLRRCDVDKPKNLAKSVTVE